MEPADSWGIWAGWCFRKRRKTHCQRWVTTGWGVRGREKQRLLEQYFEEDEALSVSLEVISKMPALCPSRTWNCTVCLWKSLRSFISSYAHPHEHWQFTTATIYYYNCVLVAEICAMDFSISSTADSGSQQMQRCQKHANEILVFFFNYM